jgi:nucleotide-binding universal stress UspA family protein
MSAPESPETSTRHLLLATDGSDLAIKALSAALALVDPPRAITVVTVVPSIDPAIVVGSGHAGPVMAVSDREQLIAERNREAQAALDATVARLGLDDAHTQILTGDPGVQLCERAAAGDIDLVVLGTSGTGGIKRALLGSTSDHVVRHAPCPVLTLGPG